MLVGACFGAVRRGAFRAGVGHVSRGFATLGVVANGANPLTWVANFRAGGHA